LATSEVKETPGFPDVIRSLASSTAASAPTHSEATEARALTDHLSRPHGHGAVGQGVSAMDAKPSTVERFATSLGQKIDWRVAKTR
jgi:hypothetical protein